MDMMIWPGNPALSAVVWLLLLSVALYLARIPAHRVILSFSRALYGAMRLAAASVSRAERKMADRNREVLLAQGREAAERVVEREFERIENGVRRELAEYPSLHRRLSEVVTHMEEDYQSSSEVPPTPPTWVGAIDAVAKIPSQSDPMVASILKDIHHSLLKVQDKTLDEYRKSSRKRHHLLNRMMPSWRKLLQLLGGVDKNISSLNARSSAVSRHMDEYEQIVKRTDRAERTLSSSSMTQFFIAAFVLVIAAGGAMINFNLIAHPMSEMVGGASYINLGFAAFQTADVAAMVIILLEIALGLFLMESLRVTRLFPVIGALNDRMRIRMAWLCFAFLFALASIEAGLAYMREILAQDDASLRAALITANGEQTIEHASRWITTAAQMGMGFILPFVLTLVAIPLESLVHSTRTVLGVALVALLRILNATLRLIGNLARSAGTLLVHVYDMLIFAPLGVEKLVRAYMHARPQRNPKTGPLASREAS